ncbi:hypothetical protein [Streptomyces sp. NBC_01264]|uniref:hypothetical protein n=1 Tax=Streptomyces sp. NBC_01264 TaxID=2903804 RepID=UPI00225469F5|nr:hypothetical protein [Streptomyces sp. NBC_01264]MCX4777977.1 hypothetical protein [Streptomyces sp. NBC_01264]
MTRHWIDRALPHHQETNVVFFRGQSLDALTRGLLGQKRLPLAYGKETGGWGLMMHDMFSWDGGDYHLTHYELLCPQGGELVVFVTEPCLGKAHGPWFEYYRDGKLTTAFSFEGPDDPVGAEPELLLPALTAARLAGPEEDFDGDDTEERIVAAVAGFFSLPELDLS